MAICIIPLWEKCLFKYFIHFWNLDLCICCLNYSTCISWTLTPYQTHCSYFLYFMAALDSSLSHLMHRNSEALPSEMYALLLLGPRVFVMTWTYSALPRHTQLHMLSTLVPILFGMFWSRVYLEEVGYWGRVLHDALALVPSQLLLLLPNCHDVTRS